MATRGKLHVGFTVEYDTTEDDKYIQEYIWLHFRTFTNLVLGELVLDSRNPKATELGMQLPTIIKEKTDG